MPQVPHANEHSRRVFISSASGEALSAYRQAAVQVCQRLKMEPVYMEDWRPQRAAPLEVCRDRIADCAVFVLLLAHRYGSRPADDSASYTELEYEAAKAQSGMEILAFILDKGPEWPRDEIDMGPDAAALDRLKARVKRAHTVKPLGDVASFRENLIFALNGSGPAVSPVSIPGPDRLSDDTEAEPAPAPTPPPIMHAVPPYVGTVTFIGRDDDLARLDEWGRSGDPVMLVEAIGGMGKSALAWEWVNYRTDTIDGLEGTLWWSFYDRPASMAKVFRELLRCMSERPPEEIERLDGTALSDEVLQWLRRRRFLVVLDGYERLLTDRDADEFVRSLAGAAPSKILITTRLKPLPLWGRFAKPIPGVQHYRLPGLTNDDMKALLGKLDVTATDHAIARFLRPLDNHPLLAGLVAGEVHEYRESPGNLDRWLADPTAGGDFRLSRLPLAKRRTHILATSFAKLGLEPRRLLETMSGIQGVIDWDTLVSINPFLPDDLTASGPDAGQPTFDQVTQAKAQLHDALKVLEQCGLLSWDRASNTYDIHAITRAYVTEQADHSSGVVPTSRVPDHFQALPRGEPSRPVSQKERELTRTIALFREYLNARHWAEASQLWASFGDPLLVDFGDYRKVVQLLEPLASKGTVAARADLALAYFHLAWYDDAIRLNVEILQEVLGDEHAIGIENTLSRLGSAYLATGAVVKSDRCEALRASIEATYHSPASGSSALKRAVHALAQGRTDEARDLFIEARRLGPEVNTPWFADSLTVEWLRLRFFTNEPLSLSEIDGAAGQVHSEAYRRRLEELRVLVLIRNGQPGRALEAIRDHDRLAHKAGIEVIPAKEAFLLASLGRHAEANAKVERTLDFLKKRDNPITTMEKRLARLRRSGSAMQALYYLARTYRTLNMPREALRHARTAYRLAWADGYPNHFQWDLTAARELLEDMGASPPALRSVNPASVKIPMEEKIRALIDKLASKDRAE